MICIIILDWVECIWKRIEGGKWNVVMKIEHGFRGEVREEFRALGWGETQQHRYTRCEPKILNILRFSSVLWLLRVLHQQQSGEWIRSEEVSASNHWVYNVTNRRTFFMNPSNARSSNDVPVTRSLFAQPSSHVALRNGNTAEAANSF